MRRIHPVHGGGGGRALEHHVNRVELWAMLNSLDASPSDDVLTKALAAAFAGIETASDRCARTRA